MKTIPKFPDFRLFSVDDINWYYNFYISKNLNPYADIHPANMMAWLNIKNDLMISTLDDTLVLRYTNVLHNNQTNIIPLAHKLKDSTVSVIMSYLKDNDLPLELREIPSIICDGLDSKIWEVEDDRDSFEYILDVEQQSSLLGSDISHQRNRVRFFEKEHQNDDIEIDIFEDLNNDIKKICLDFTQKMPFNSRDEAARENIFEPIAFQKNLESASLFHKKALIIKINGNIESISLFSNLDKYTASGNHLKVNYAINNIFRYTIYKLAQILKKEGMNEINIEQDLGAEGIREFKKHLPPSRFLEKVTIRPRYQ